MAHETRELTIESLAAGGDGVGRTDDGLVVFVPFTAPGDRVRVQVRERRARHAHGVVEALLEAGPARTEPLCGVYGSCGGCTWQHVAYASQLEAKRAILRDALVRIGKVALPDEIDVIPCPQPYGYRGRSRVLVKEGRVGYRRRRSHALCATSRCPVLVPELDAELAALARRAPAETGEWELVAGRAGQTRATPLRRPLADGPAVTLEVDGDRLAVSPGVFVQGNALLLDELARSVHEAAGKGRLGAELFAGAGFFTPGLARRFGRLVVVESEGRAVADLRRNLAAADVHNVDVECGRAERVLQRLEGVEVVLVDPPRTGLPPGTLDALARLRPRRLVYVSCEPATLARDLASAAAEGFALRTLRALDLFPQTPHLEAIAVLEAARGER